MKWFPIIALLGLGVAVSCLSLVAPRDGHVTLSNTTAEAIVRAQVGVCGQDFTIEHLGPGENRTVTFRIRADSHYTVSVRFASGRSMSKELGYITSGIDVADMLLIKENDVLLALKRENFTLPNGL